MRLEYTLEDDDETLTLRMRGVGKLDRKAAFQRLKKLGAPIEIVHDGIQTKAQLHKVDLDRLRAAVKLVGGRLGPARGQPLPGRLAASSVRYEDVRPDDPDELMRLAAKDEDPGALVDGAIQRFRQVAIEHPVFRDRVERDVKFLRRVRERFAPERDEPADDGTSGDPVKREVSRMLQGVPSSEMWKARELLIDLHRVAADTGREAPRAEVPDPIPGFLGKLRDYQRDGVAFLLGRELNAVLADEMGLGKTVMTLAAVLAADERALVVAPANVLHNWAAEVERFTGEKAALWHGRELSGPDDARFRITTYDSLRLYDWRHTDAGDRPVLVLDEAHMIRNPDTQRARVVRELPQDKRILLTGTPVVNGLEDYNELLLHVGEGLWADRSTFRETWKADRGSMSRHPKVRQAVADLLQRATRHVVLRRRKDAVLTELPPRTITVDRHVLDDDEQRVYDGLEQRAREVMARPGTSEVQVFTQLHKLRQHLVKCRVPLVLERVRELVDSGEAVVVYAHYLDPLDKLEKGLSSALADTLGDRAVGRIDGSVNPRERERLARALGSDEGPQVLLAQMEAGGVGLNLVGARYVVFVHLGWTAAVHKQAIDRVHRIGQDRPVQVEFYVSPDTIDERMVDVVLQKQADANLALQEEGEVLDRSSLARALLAEGPVDG